MTSKMSQKNVGDNNKYEGQDRSSGQMVNWCPGQTELNLIVFLTHLKFCYTVTLHGFGLFTCTLLMLSSLGCWIFPFFICCEACDININFLTHIQHSAGRLLTMSTCYSHLFWCCIQCSFCHYAHSIKKQICVIRLC
jgi:hypothetical protein